MTRPCFWSEFVISPARCCNIASLTMASPVKHCLRILIRALRRERHFALVEDVPVQPRLARNHLRAGLSPTHASLRSRTAIMIPTSDSSVKRSGIPNQLLGVRLHTIAMSGLSHVRTELFQLLVVPSLAHHPKQTNSWVLIEFDEVSAVCPQIATAATSNIGNCVCANDWRNQNRHGQT